MLILILLPMQIIPIFLATFKFTVWVSASLLFLTWLLCPDAVLRFICRWCRSWWWCDTGFTPKRPCFLHQQKYYETGAANSPHSYKWDLSSTRQWKVGRISQGSRQQRTYDVTEQTRHINRRTWWIYSSLDSEDDCHWGRRSISQCHQQSFSRLP